MALNPYINSFDTEADYDEYLDGSTAKAPNVAYIRATDEMKYTKTIPNPTWIIYGTTSGTTDFYVGSNGKSTYSSSYSGIHLHVQNGIFYATADDIVGTIACFYGNKSGFSNTEGKNITKLKRWTYPNTDVTDMSEMFRNCSSLTSADLSNFNTSKVTSMRSMFHNCQNITTIDISNFNTTNVTDMSYMFEGCNSITSLDVSSFDTRNLVNADHMFNGLGVTTLDISNFETTNVVAMTETFRNCGNLNKLILGSGFFNSTSLTSYQLKWLSAWTDADSLETFVQAAEVHNGTGKTIQLSTQTKNALTQAQKDRLTGAGWAIG